MKAQVIFTPSGKRGQVETGTSVLDAARQLGVDLDSVCGGNGVCSKCMVVPAFGDHAKHGITAGQAGLSEINAVERRYDEKRGLKPGQRLGCQAQILGDMVIDIPSESQVHKQVVRKAVTNREFTRNPAISTLTLDVAPADMHAPTGDFERVQAAVRAKGHLLAPLSLSDLTALQRVLAEGNDQITLALHSSGALTGLWAGHQTPALYGVAVDLGSTTIAAHLTDLRSGEVLQSGGIMNPQIKFGEDLMSRVSYAMMNEGGAADMTAAVREALDELIIELCSEAKITSDEVYDVVCVMNPVMHHLLLGLDPVPLGQAPFALATNSSLTVPAQDLDLHIAPRAQVYILPLIAGHVGADAAAVALSEAPQTQDPLTLIIDVGTNAEIILGNKTRVLACSSPTGPAFEGAQITHGQRAAPGAIEHVEIDPITKEPRIKVIGCELWSDDPEFELRTAASGITGICGSGIIEAIAEMRAAGVVDQGGLIGSPEAAGTERSLQSGRTYEYLLHKGEVNITVTQGDVRAIQLAKSALYAGARLLIDEFGTDRVERVVLAGAFGAHISPKHAMILGMIPDCAFEHVTSAGNAAGTGALMALLDKEARGQIERLVNEITKIETAIEPRFQEHFVAANALPHASDPFEILRAHVPLPDQMFNSSDTPRRRRRRD